MITHERNIASGNDLPDSVQSLVRESSSKFSVDTRVYTDTGIFELEMQRVFESSWVYVAHESEVQQAGDYRTAHIGHQPVIVTRTEDGGLHVLLNVCRHRGSTVCRESRGNSSVFRCPYHGWLYRNDGKLIGVTERRGFPDQFSVDEDGLVSAGAVESYRGLMFTRLARSGPNLREYLGGISKHIDLWADMSPTGTIEVKRPHRYDFEGNWKLQAENGMDGYHPKFVHESAFQTLHHFGGPDFNSLRAIGYTGGFDSGHSVLGAPRAEGAPRIGLTTLAADTFERHFGRLVEAYGASRAELLTQTRHIFVFPNLCLMDVNIRVFQPLSVAQTEVYSHFFALDGVDDEVNVARLRDLQQRLGTAGLVNTDDVEMFAACQTGISSHGIREVLFARGVDREVQDDDGMWRGLYADETPQRALYRGWVKLMDGASAGADVHA